MKDKNGFEVRKGLKIYGVKQYGTQTKENKMRKNKMELALEISQLKKELSRVSGAYEDILNTQEKAKKKFAKAFHRFLYSSINEDEKDMAVYAREVKERAKKCPFDEKVKLQYSAISAKNKRALAKEGVTEETIETEKVKGTPVDKHGKLFKNKVLKRRGGMGYTENIKAISKLLTDEFGIERIERIEEAERIEETEKETKDKYKRTKAQIKERYGKNGKIISTCKSRI